METRNIRKERTGIVVSNKMDRTAVLKIERRVKHAKYGKFVHATSRIMFHDEKNECQIGDKVKVMETRPLSKNKSWRLVEILERVK